MTRMRIPKRRITPPAPTYFQALGKSMQALASIANDWTFGLRRMVNHMKGRYGTYQNPPPPGYAVPKPAYLNRQSQHRGRRTR